MDDQRNVEGKRQDLCGKLVDREIYCCVSSLMSGIMEISQQVGYKQFKDAFCEDQDELSNLFSVPDYEEAARAFIMDDADVDQLEEMADEHGYWSDVLDACLGAISESEPDEDGSMTWTFVGNADKIGYADVFDAQAAAIEEALPRIREAVLALADSASQEVCNEYNLEPDYLEVYEHYAVSNWLQRKLAERGEITGDFAGLTIWGRTCTGQSISMDYVIRSIAQELWPEEWAGEKA